MSMGEELLADSAFERDFPYGVHGDVWNSKDGPVKLSDMSEQHIRSCMRIVGEDDGWYGRFEKELERRGLTEKGSRYFRLKVPKRELGRGVVDGGFDVVFDREHIRSVLVRSDGAAYVNISGMQEPCLVYKDEADRLLSWMYGSEGGNHEH